MWRSGDQNHLKPVFEIHADITVIYYTQHDYNNNHNLTTEQKIEREWLKKVEEITTSLIDVICINIEHLP